MCWQRANSYSLDPIRHTTEKTASGGTPHRSMIWLQKGCAWVGCSHTVKQRVFRHAHSFWRIPAVFPVCRHWKWSLEFQYASYCGQEGRRLLWKKNVCQENASKCLRSTGRVKNTWWFLNRGRCRGLPHLRKVCALLLQEKYTFVQFWLFSCAWILVHLKAT